MGRSSTFHVKNSIRWYLGKSVQIEETWVRATQKPCWNCTTWRFHQKISMPNCQKLKTCVKRRKDKNYVHETLTPSTGKLKKEQWSRVERDYSASLEEKVSVTSWKKKASVRMETNAVSGMRVTIVRENQNTKPPHLLIQPYHEVEVCRGKEVSEAKVSMGPSFDTRADYLRVLVRERLFEILASARVPILQHRNGL